MGKAGGTGKPGSKPARSAGKAGRRDTRRTLSLQDRGFKWRVQLRKPETYTAAGLGCLFVLGVTMVIWWVSGQALVAESQIARETAVARAPFKVPDIDATKRGQDQARERADRIYVAYSEYFERLRSNLKGLPAAVAGKATVEELTANLVTTYAMTQDALTALQQYVDETGKITPAWNDLVDRFIDQTMYAHPLIESDRYQVDRLAPAPIQLRLEGRPSRTIFGSQLIDVAGESIERTLAPLVEEFEPSLRPRVIARLQSDLQPTFWYDEPSTLKAQEEAAAGVAQVYSDYETGHVIYRRGDRLTANQVALAQQEYAQYTANAPRVDILVSRFGSFGVTLLTTILFAGYLGRFHPVTLRKPIRILIMILLMIGLLALTSVAAASTPRALLLYAFFPTLMLAVVSTVAYGQRFALVIGLLYAIFVCYALRLPVGYYALFVGGIGTNVYLLREIRDRDRLVMAGAATAVVAALGSMIMCFAYLPAVEGLFRTALIDGLSGAASALLVGVFTLGILSTVERVFNVTTGLTLVELRDPKQYLLRELQQRAPGTYNHSLQVANLAEAGAAAIGANSLLTYVGALYHDIGKMNKPAYFIENQEGGPNRHSKLSPAMSLLIIVGHVKDGIEMAREHGLPKPLRHFIEAHHGTTLVEYFYHVAKEKAASGETNDQVEEIEYRYPGPKPRTREAAVLMLSDTLESATRAMGEPTPSRIEQLVRSLAEKRLIDGQFDDCDLTLRELRIVEDSLIKSLCAVHHARVSYPSDQQQPATNSAAAGPSESDGAKSNRTAAQNGSADETGRARSDRQSEGDEKRLSAG
ncbi:MAG: HDIG domain-containing protein [Planctomycetes bacterium]|nr:HDIG domain-containing protein [Planctomycetota bacterium]NOG54378.1 HDIG domain-containing protein [Planctomycetota bacterium]